MKLSEITEGQARCIIYRCKNAATHPPSFCNYVNAHYSNMWNRSVVTDEKVNYHKLLTFLTRDCGWASYKIINKVAKDEVYR